MITDRFFFGGIGSGVLSDAQREEHDFYTTDPYAVEWLLKIESIDKNVWEPACGLGHISKALEAAGHQVKSTDLVDRGYGTGGFDFLLCNDPFPGDIVTNPPYKLAVEFIYHALDLVPTGNKVVMFLKTTFFEGKRHRKLFEAHPPKRIWVSSSRISCWSGGVKKGGGSMISYAWYVWEKGYKGPVELKWFN